jgi:2-hydroxychromene-2-carboxylate isomerase
MNSPRPPADWYFDYVSPFAYLQVAIHREIFREWPGLRLRPVVFGALLDRWGQRGPAEIVSKRRFTYDHVQWLARHHGVPLRFPPRHPFLSLGALRLTIVAGGGLDVVLRVFDFLWAEGREADTVEGLAALAAELGVDPARAQDRETKAALRAHGEAAAAAGVFGVPTFVVGGELFWGLDATPMLIDFLKAPASFDTEELRRVRVLPQGIERRAVATPAALNRPEGQR